MVDYILTLVVIVVCALLVWDSQKNLENDCNGNCCQGRNCDCDQ